MFWVGSWSVLGPEIADMDLGGAGAWAIILATNGVRFADRGVILLNRRVGLGARQEILASA